MNDFISKTRQSENLQIDLSLPISKMSFMAQLMILSADYGAMLLWLNRFWSVQKINNYKFKQQPESSASEGANKVLNHFKISC